MKLAILRERRAHERRVAATPETVKKFIAMGATVTVEHDAGTLAGFPDADYVQAGAIIGADLTATLAGASIVLKVQPPFFAGEADDDEVAAIPQGAILVGMLNPHGIAPHLGQLAERNILAFALELVPRITRAQSMDVLSSQSNLAGYGAVIRAASLSPRAFPMMMTAAGTVAPVRALIMGAGVAGLQAIATARRLGAIVSATDVRPAAKEQVQSLGGNFVAVEDDEFKQAEAAGGYAKEMSAAYREKQAALIAETIRKQDVVITTALIPGRKAPILVTEEMVRSMKPGSVIVDLAAEQGGNCALSQPGKVIEVAGVTIAADHFPAALLAADASQLYARNLLSFLTPLIDKDTKTLKINWDDEIVKATVLTRDGAIVHPSFKSEGA